jgi:ABC-type sulfate transport system permease component
MHTYTAWVSNAKPTVLASFVVGALVCIFSIAMGYVFLRWYDIPVRTWLQRKFLA